MLKIFYCNPLDYIENHLYENIYLLPDSISIRNIEIYMLKERGKEYFPAENFLTIDQLGLKELGKNYRIISRFMQRYLAEESLKEISYYRDLHSNENFITLLLNEYLEIKENMLVGIIPSKKGEFFRAFDERYSRELEKLARGIKIDDGIFYYLLREEITCNLAKKFSGINNKKIVIAGFYYINPTLEYFIENARKNNEIIFISEPLDEESSRILEEKLSPDHIEGKHIEKFQSEMYELPDMRREVKFIANFIMEKMEKENLNYSDFVVAFPEAKKYQWYVEEIFGEYGIPIFIETRIKFSEYEFFSLFRSRLNEFKGDLTKDNLGKIIQEILLEHGEEQEGIMKMWQAIDEFFIEIKALSLDGSTDLKNLLISYLSTVSFGRFYGDYDTVPVLDLGNVHFRKGKYLIIGGMNEEFFPRPLRSNIIFTNESQGIRRRDFKTHEANERYRLFSAITNFRNILFTLPYFNNEGKRLLHSYIIDFLIKKGITNPKVKRMVSSEIIFNEEKIFSDKDLQILKREESVEEMEEDLCAIEGIREKVKNFEFTPSQITDYNKCPRKFFFAHVLGIKYPEEELSPTFQGNIVHRILKEFYDKNRNLLELSKRTEIEIRKEGQDIVNKITIEHEEANTLKNRLVRHVTNYIKLDLMLNREREVYGTEIPFTLQIAGTKISGRIDRIDKLRDYYLIIDYKYSNINGIKNLVIRKKEELNYPGKDLNLPIYIYWLLRRERWGKFVAFYVPVKMKKTKDNRWLYLYMNSTIPSGFHNYNQGAYYDNIFIKLLEERIEEIINNVRKCIFPRTDNEKNCRDCEYRMICGGKNGL